MRITQISAHTVSTNYRDAWQHDRRYYIKTENQANTILTVETDSGLSGIGEAAHSPGLYGETPSSTLGALNLVKPHLLGRQALNRNELLNLVDRVMPLGNLAFISALDQAFHDLAGKALNVPVVELLGGKAHQTLPTHISPPTNDSCLDYLNDFLSQGYRVFKIKMSGDTRYDLDLIGNALDAVGESVTLALDANQGWSVPQTLAIAHAIQAHPSFKDNIILEQPVRGNDFEGMAQIRRGTRLRLMADDGIRTNADLLRLIRLEAADIVSIKISRVGGIRKALAMVAMAEAANLLYIIDEINEMRVCNTAVAHLALATRAPLYTGVTCHLLLERDVVAEGGVRVINGQAVIDDQPGLGIGRLNLDTDN
ncbi:MAG: hypothetical protein LBK28_00315 [Propionibacteriaceae bacterium]|jgi:L-alanine-DL-glutamate epimerase-like enolase superfamily enzyme|nr:hypothetical protein [Propionibacteriaceae bacterium]